MTRGLRKPAALRDRRLSAAQEVLIHLLYAAQERTVAHDDLICGIFEDGTGTQYKLMKLVYEARRSIQGTGWHIETDHSRGYRMVWADRDVPEKPPELTEQIGYMVADQRAMRADLVMLADDFRQALAELVGLPPHLLLPASTWTVELDDMILETKGITGQLAVIAEEHGIDPAAVTSRYKALRKAR